MPSAQARGVTIRQRFPSMRRQFAVADLPLAARLPRPFVLMAQSVTWWAASLLAHQSRQQAGSLL